MTKECNDMEVSGSGIQSGLKLAILHDDDVRTRFRLDSTKIAELISEVLWYVFTLSMLLVPSS